MVRLVRTLALALLLSGCSLFLSGDPVTIVTDTKHEYDGSDLSCWLGIGEDSVLLVADPDFGTALAGRDGTRGVPAIWPPGYTGRRDGSEVKVYDPHGSLVARTGRRYYIDWVSSGGTPFGQVICDARPAWSSAPLPDRSTSAHEREADQSDGDRDEQASSQDGEDDARLIRSRRSADRVRRRDRGEAGRRRWGRGAGCAGTAAGS